MQQLRCLVQFRTRWSRLCQFEPLQSVKRHCAATGSRWTCACGFLNYAFHRQCFRCSAARNGPSAAPQASPMSLLDRATEASKKCASQDDAAAAPVQPAEGVWMCASCNTFNRRDRGACTHCGVARPGPPPADCVRRGAQASEVVSAARNLGDAKQPFRRGDWYCSCGAHNFARNARCRDCQAAKPAEATAVLRHGGSGEDWVCRECGKYNFARRTECMRCRHPQPASRGQQESNRDVNEASSQGWVCQVCHSMNPVDADAACAICGSPK